MIRPAETRDAPAIAEIYNHYVRESIATFELEPVADAEMARRIEETRRDHPWLVAEEAGRVVGYAYAHRFHAREAYKHTAELSVYLDPACCGRGWGRRLMAALLEALERQPLHVLIWGVSLPNPASVALAEKHGFTKAAHYTQVGRKFGRWIDVGYWQKVVQ